jgi:hypothetical protein
MDIGIGIDVKSPACHAAAVRPGLFFRAHARRVESAACPSPRPPRAPLADGLQGPGWFDSSWDLRQGLEVREGLPADARLHEWIEACLLD